MKILEKIELIKKLTEKLRSNYDEDDLRIFFDYYKLKIEWFNYDSSGQDCEIHIKNTLSHATEDTLIKISSELETGSEYIARDLPENWKFSQNSLKIFISHLAEHKDKATQLKEALKPYYIDCFVAHDDMYPTLKWQNEIEKALQTMDVFISIHCQNFKNSEWCQQEVGAAIIRNVKIIPIKFDGKEDPVGFISSIQGLTRTGKDRYMLAKEIVNIIKEDKRTKDLYAAICLQNESTFSNEFIADEEIPF